METDKTLSPQQEGKSCSTSAVASTSAEPTSNVRCLIERMEVEIASNKRKALSESFDDEDKTSSPVKPSSEDSAGKVQPRTVKRRTTSQDASSVEQSRDDETSSPVPNPEWTPVVGKKEKKKKKKKSDSKPDIVSATLSPTEKVSAPGTSKVSAPTAKPKSAKEQVLTEAVPAPNFRSLGLVSSEVQKVEAEVRKICFDSTKKISKEVGGNILGHVSTLTGLVQELLLRNSYLEGQLRVASGEIKRSQAVTETAVSKTLKAAKRLEATTVTGVAPKRPVSTYAQAVKVDCRRVSPDAVKPPQHVVKIFPQNEKTDSDATKQTVLSLIKPAKTGIRVRAVRRIHSGGIAVETEDSKDLAVFMQNKKLEKAGLRSTLQAKRNPALIVYDVPSSQEEEEFVSCLRKQNLTGVPEEELQSIKVRKNFGTKYKERRHWVLEVSPLVREEIKKKGNRVFLGWSACRVQDYVAVTHCYKCQGFGHIAKHCRAPVDVCGHCSEKGHTMEKCKARNKPAVCPNCKHGQKPHDHRARTKSCPLYKAALELVLSKTNYG